VEHRARERGFVFAVAAAVGADQVECAQNRKR
jgi:hypothetical protein